MEARDGTGSEIGDTIGFEFDSIESLHLGMLRRIMSPKTILCFGIWTKQWSMLCWIVGDILLRRVNGKARDDAMLASIAESW